jgi:hypothetical protein
MPPPVLVASAYPERSATTMSPSGAERLAVLVEHQRTAKEHAPIGSPGEGLIERQPGRHVADRELAELRQGVGIRKPHRPAARAQQTRIHLQHVRHVDRAARLPALGRDGHQRLRVHEAERLAVAIAECSGFRRLPADGVGGLRRDAVLQPRRVVEHLLSRQHERIELVQGHQGRRDRRLGRDHLCAFGAPGGLDAGSAPRRGLVLDDADRVALRRFRIAKAEQIVVGEHQRPDLLPPLCRDQNALARAALVLLIARSDSREARILDAADLEIAHSNRELGHALEAVGPRRICVIHHGRKRRAAERRRTEQGRAARGLLLDGNLGVGRGNFLLERVDLRFEHRQLRGFGFAQLSLAEQRIQLVERGLAGPCLLGTGLTQFLEIFLCH